MVDILIQILMLAVIVGVGVIMICGVRWAMEDAADRGGSMILAAILVLFFFPVGLWIWMLVRPELKREDVVRRLRRELEG